MRIIYIATCFIQCRARTDTVTVGIIILPASTQQRTQYNNSFLPRDIVYLLLVSTPCDYFFWCKKPGAYFSSAVPMTVAANILYQNGEKKNGTHPAPNRAIV